MLSCVTVCSASDVSRYSELVKYSLEIRRDWQVLSCTKVCLASAVLLYCMLGECNLVLRHAW